MQVINNLKKYDIQKKILPEQLERILPFSLTDKIRQRAENNFVEEIRLRCNRESSIVSGGKNIMLGVILDGNELNDILKSMCGGSLYAYSDTINQGYISLPDGVRVGVCGRAACEENRIIGVYDITSLCIRIPHRTRRVGGRICSLLSEFKYTKGVLVYSPPGVGKTTVLRGVAAILSGGSDPLRTVIIDTRGELAYLSDSSSLCLDILSGYPRRKGVEIATRTLNPQVIICDEIGDYEEAMSLVSSHNCGVPLVASAHAGSLSELLLRTGIRLLYEAGIFGAYVGLKRAPDMDFYYDVTLHEEVHQEIFTL